MALSAMVAICAAPTMGAALPGGVALDQPERHHTVIGGRVFDAFHHPVGHATVTLHTEDGRLLRETTSNDRGYFRFGHVRPGVYLVRGFKRGVGHDQVRHNTRGDRHRVILVLH